MCPFSCKFELSHPTRIFYDGDQICGKVTIGTTKRVDLDGISINLAGFERVQWSEHLNAINITYDDSTTNETKDNQIVYEGSKEHILTTLQLSEAFALEPGEFVAQFSLTLPERLLATCAQKYGTVDYHLQVVIQPKGKWQKVFKKRVILRNRLDLNTMQALQQSRTICCHALTPQDAIEIFIPFSGFVPGQLLPFGIRMTQLLQSAKVLINLCQKIVYTSQLPAKKSKETIKVLDYHIATSSEFSHMQIPLATEISTSLDHALLKISYYLECLILDEKLEVSHKTLVPLTIGTVILKSSENIKDFEQQRLYYYDNLAISKTELQTQDRSCQKLVNFDQIIWATQKCTKYKNRKVLLSETFDLKKMCTKIYKKIAI